ncbi:MAG TPA: ATP-binding protein [Ktedonobacteraceae bacterium]|nr:ATP-binding protein [Ktedonobacteraceae bacterium]
MAILHPRNKLTRRAETALKSQRFARMRTLFHTWRELPYSGVVTLLLSTLLATLLVMLFDRSVVTLVNPGLIYLPIIAMIAYHWKWYLAVIGALLQLFCVYFFFLPPFNSFSVSSEQAIAQLIVLAAAMGFVLAIVQLARYGRSNAERAAARFEALNRIGAALTSELDESRLLHTIAETARSLTNAGFAAFTLRPINELGEPLVPSEGHLFHLAAVVGVTKEQEQLLRHMPLGGEGLLAPIFHHGMAVRVPDALVYLQQSGGAHGGKVRMTSEDRLLARQAAFDYAHGNLDRDGLRSMGVPRGHPIVRSFLGVPLLDRAGNVRGGLLLGHSDPDCFTLADEQLLVGLAAQAAIALENARLYSAAQTQARELDAIFESIADGIMLVDEQGEVLRENRTARHLREQVASMQADQSSPTQQPRVEDLLREAATRAQVDATEPGGIPATIIDNAGDAREFVINASPLRPPSLPLLSEQDNLATHNELKAMNGSVVVWHDVTEAHRLLIEQQAHAETEARRALLQTVIDELPGGVYLVRGHDARLVLANRAIADVWGATWQYDQPMIEFLEQNDIRLFHFDGRSLTSGELATLRAVRRGESIYHQQEIIRHKDGTALPVLVNAVALDPLVLGWNGESVPAESDPEPAAIVVHQDVTALREAERLKDEFIGIAAHELRTPLAVIKGFAQMLISQTARGKGPALADWQSEAIQDIDQATIRLVELTEDLLDVTRLQGGRLELHPEPTDLVALAQRIAARVRVTTSKHSVTIHTGTEHLVATIDPRRIEQVLSNLLNNAIKYSPDGGEITITLREDRPTCSAILTVQDNGIGIPAGQQGRIFGRFARADNARDSNISGTGLGLYLCRELVERHNGRIWFESVEGHGSTFYVALPLEKSA